MAGCETVGEALIINVGDKQGKKRWLFFAKGIPQSEENERSK